jgi:phospholipid transport system substrate-binding protein
MPHTTKLLLFPLLFMALGLPLFARAGEATDQIRQTTDKILAIVQDPALKGADKEGERQRQMKAAIDERFDWAAMARGAIGKHWRDLSEAQRAEFSSLFGELVEKTYLSQVEGYSGEKIQYKAEKEDGKFGVVDVLIVTLRETSIPVSYRVLKKGAAWFVYDVSIEGVSFVNNYRSQIGSILDTSTYADLIAKIQAKIAVAGSRADGKTKKSE